MRSRTPIRPPIPRCRGGRGARIWVQGAAPVVPDRAVAPGTDAPPRRGGAVAVALDDGRVLIVGGRAAGRPVAAWISSAPDGSVSASAPLSTPRAGHAAVRLPDGSVLVAGGTTMVQTGVGAAEAPTASAELYLPASGVWMPVGSLGAPRTGLTATALADGRVLVAGGSGGSGALDSMEVFDVAAGAFHPAGHPVGASRGHAAAAAGRPGARRRRPERGGRAGDGGFRGRGLGQRRDPDAAGPSAEATATALIDGRVFWPAALTGRATWRARKSWIRLRGRPRGWVARRRRAAARRQCCSITTRPCSWWAARPAGP